MLAARDQENLVHGHQAAAAAKPLNQGTRQLAPKTPGNKAPKTSFKPPLNDENDVGAFGLGKTGLKNNGPGKNAFATPIGPKNNRPLGVLGMKTTNAKTKAFQTPAPPAGNDLGKTNQKSVSARKAKPRVSHAEMTKLEVLGDKDEPEQIEIEYMPPKPKDLPDHPDDLPALNLSMFENGNLLDGAMSYFATRKGEDGLSHVEREEQRREKQWAIMDLKNEALMQRSLDSMPIPCTHYPECPGELCKDTIEARKNAEDVYQKAIAAIDAKAAPIPRKNPAQGPSAIKSKAAAAALSQPKRPAPNPRTTTKPASPTTKPRLNSSLLPRPKNKPLPTNPSQMRHASAIAASKTTMGYSKGRAVSATVRKTIFPMQNSKPLAKAERDTSLAPTEYFERYGEPPFGSEMWLRCEQAGCFDEEDGGDPLEDIFRGGKGLDELVREDAMEEFQLTLV